MTKFKEVVRMKKAVKATLIKVLKPSAHSPLGRNEINSGLYSKLQPSEKGPFIGLRIGNW